LSSCVLRPKSVACVRVDLMEGSQEKFAGENLILSQTRTPSSLPSYTNLLPLRLFPVAERTRYLLLVLCSFYFAPPPTGGQSSHARPKFEVSSDVLGDRAE